MKSAEEILNKTITGDENDGHWFNGELGRKEALQAMHEYAAPLPYSALRAVRLQSLD